MTKLLSEERAPDILIEVNDSNTRGFNYGSNDIIDWLLNKQYKLFNISAASELVPYGSKWCKSENIFATKK